MTRCWKESGRALESWTCCSGSPSAVRQGHICCCKGQSTPLRPSLNGRNRSFLLGGGKLRQSRQQPMVIFLPEVPCEMPGKYLFTELSLEAQCKKLHWRKRAKQHGEQCTNSFIDYWFEFKPSKRNNHWSAALCQAVAAVTAVWTDWSSQPILYHHLSEGHVY